MDNTKLNVGLRVNGLNRFWEAAESINTSDENIFEALDF
jgi:hypothetical protein